MSYAPPPLVEPERFLRACLVIGALMNYEGTEEYRAASPPQSPYQGHEGQRPGESFTAYRIRVRKEGNL